MIGYVNQGINWYRRGTSELHAVSASLFVRNEKFGLTKTKDGKSSEYANLPFDMLIDESHELEFDITDNAVENGAVISDHIVQKTRKLTITGFFTNHSINGSSRFLQQGDLSQDDYKSRAAKVVGDDDYKSSTIDIENAPAVTNVSRERWETLLKLAKERKKVRVITALEVYDEMFIERVSADRSPSDGESIKFTMVLREVRAAKLKTDEAGGEWNPPQPSSQDQPKQQALSKQKNAGNVSGDTSADVDSIVEKQNRGLGRNYG